MRILPKVSVIIPGISIGDFSVVGAGSIVAKDISDFEIWAGMSSQAHNKKRYL
jgi:acetyltransferase-like isoleucine patch superfamily enzyme